MPVVSLVPVLVQRQPGARSIAVDEARIRHETRVAGPIRGTARQLAEALRHRRPRLAGFGVDPIIAIARVVSQPACLSAIGHRDRHRRAPWRRHMPERRLRGDVAKCGENVVHERQGETAKQHGTGRDHFLPVLFGNAGVSGQIRHQRLRAASYQYSGAAPAGNRHEALPASKVG